MATKHRSAAALARTYKDQQLIQRALDRAATHGMDRPTFAARVMVRDERTITRWLYGEGQIPEVARRRLRAFLSEPRPA